MKKLIKITNGINNLHEESMERQKDEEYLEYMKKITQEMYESMGIPEKYLE